MRKGEEKEKMQEQEVEVVEGSGRDERVTIQEGRKEGKERERKTKEIRR